MKTSLELTTLPPIFENVLDVLADGQWHPFSNISKDVVALGDEKSKGPDSKERLGNVLSELVDGGVLLLGENRSYRFTVEELLRWRTISDNPKIHEQYKTPRFFGGILEDDGWAVAPLKKYDLVHFKADSSLERSVVCDVVGGDDKLIQIDGSLFRIFHTKDRDVLSLIKSFKEKNPDYGISGVRLETGLRRRNLSDLPAGFLSDLCEYYGEFAGVLLRPHESSVLKHIPDRDDTLQQKYLWVLDAVQRYDDSRNIPFGAYLGTSLNKWVFNLNRAAFGRSVADTELKYARAISSHKLVYGKPPTVEELGKILKKSQQSVANDIAIVDRVVNLRHISTIHTLEGDIPLPAKESVEDNLDELASNTLLSAAIISACDESLKNSKSGTDLTALIGLYYLGWGKDIASKKIKTWLRSAKAQEVTKRSMTSVLEKIRKEG